MRRVLVCLFKQSYMTRIQTFKGFAGTAQRKIHTASPNITHVEFDGGQANGILCNTYNSFVRHIEHIKFSLIGDTPAQLPVTLSASSQTLRSLQCLELRGRKTRQESYWYWNLSPTCYAPANTLKSLIIVSVHININWLISFMVKQGSSLESIELGRVQLRDEVGAYRCWERFFKDMSKDRESLRITRLYFVGLVEDMNIDLTSRDEMQKVVLFLKGKLVERIPTHPPRWNLNYPLDLGIQFSGPSFSGPRLISHLG